jgi:hypothetical protein
MQSLVTNFHSLELESSGTCFRHVSRIREKSRSVNGYIHQYTRRTLFYAIFTDWINISEGLFPREWGEKRLRDTGFEPVYRSFRIPRSLGKSEVSRPFHDFEMHVQTTLYVS